MKNSTPQIEALGRCLCICIQASVCPTCGADPGALCHSKSGKVVASHVTRTRAGHELLETPILTLVDAHIKTIPSEEIVAAIQKTINARRLKEHQPS